MSDQERKPEADVQPPESDESDESDVPRIEEMDVPIRDLDVSFADVTRADVEAAKERSK